MESVAYFQNHKISPKKLRFLLAEVKKVSPIEAMDRLFYIPKKPAKILYQAIRSAVSNAKATLKVSDNLLEFKTLAVDEGFKLKRYNPGARGNAKPFKRRYSHIKIVLVAMEKKNLKSKIQNLESKNKTKKSVKLLKRTKKHGTKS